MQPTRDRFWAKVDKTTSSTGCWVWTAARDRHGYGRFNDWAERRVVFAHRWAYRDATGELPDRGIDHICHNPSCVNPTHLRPAGQKQNTENQNGLRTNNTSGYRGVTWCKQKRAWVARVRHHGHVYHCGFFADPAQAGEAALRKRLEFFTHNDEDRMQGVPS